MPLLTFCKLVLDYENYPDYDDLPEDRKRHSSSPLGSTGSSSGSGWEQGPPPPPTTSTLATNASSSSNGPSAEINHNATVVKKEDLPMTPARQTPRPTSPDFQSSPDHDHGTEDSSAVDD